MTFIAKTRLYEQDFVAWTEQTLELIRAGKFEQIDWEAVGEEIESLGKSNRRELKSCLEMLLQHLLKWQYQPNLRSNSWWHTIDEQRNRVEDLLLDSPSLKPYMEEVLADCYRRSRRAASHETNLVLDTFPSNFPYSTAQILDTEFLP